MYTDRNFKTKKELKLAVGLYLAGKGPPITYHQPGLGATPTDGKVYLEGPHYPHPHKWYAEAIVKNSMIIKVI